MRSIMKKFSRKLFEREFKRLLHRQGRTVVMFDMGDVLVRLDKRALGLSKVGFWRLVRYMITHVRTPGRIKQLVLDLYAPDQTLLQEPWVQELQACYRALQEQPVDDGRLVPDIVSAWQRGDVSSELLRAKIREHSVNNFAKKVYASREEQEIIYELAAALSDAYALAACTQVLQAGVDFLQQAARAGHMIMIVSNWDMASFDLLRQKFHKEIFQYIHPEHIILSAQVGLLKPCPEIYELALQRARAAIQEPFEAYFVDNELANVRMAQRCGMHGICHTF